MKKYTIGLDFGTNSCRSVIVDITNGRELATHVFAYPSGESGVIGDPGDPNLARQNPADYMEAINITIKESLCQAEDIDKGFSKKDIIGIGVDTTGSSPMPVDVNGSPLCFQGQFKNNSNAMVWLWKDHTSFSEAAKITELAAEIRPEYLAKIGGVYSSEWFWSKILHCKHTDPQVFDAASSFVEICDYIPGILVGEIRPDKLKRSVCAAGHKAMFNRQWGGLPDIQFLKRLSPGLEKLRDHLYQEAFAADHIAGYLAEEWTTTFGLSSGVVVAVGAFDAHMGAVGAGIRPGTLVKILGTSTCDIMVWPNKEDLPDIPGVCGIVDGSVIGGYFGIEAGQSAVGDIFLWFVNQLVPDRYGKTTEEKFHSLAVEAEKLRPGESGLLALDWNNGNRTILVDVRLTGLLLGQTLHTQPHEIYRALIESTAYGALAIIDRIEENGIPVDEVVNCGGLVSKNPLLMQIYADVTSRPMKVSKSHQTPALGAAIFGAVAAGKEKGGYASVLEAQKAMTGIEMVYIPNQVNRDIYKKLYGLYRQLHNGFGTLDWSGHMYNVMKDLLRLRDRVREGN